MDDGSYTIKPKDPSAIVRLQDASVIDQLLENPPAVLADLLAGWFFVGNGFIVAAGCRIAQAAFKARSGTISRCGITTTLVRWNGYWLALAHLVGTSPG
jgi:hypothetical protein